MFRRPAHRALARVIEAFDAQVLRRCRFLFGGGTRIALDLDEYRESRDLDFLCSDETGYGDLRWLAARADRQVLSRDLVDLAALRRFRGPVPPEAWDAAERAYRAAAREDLEKAIAAFAEDPEQQRRSFEGLAVESPAAILEGVALLRDDLAGRTR